jgi:hypothetical protein
MKQRNASDLLVVKTGSQSCRIASYSLALWKGGCVDCWSMLVRSGERDGWVSTVACTIT